MERRSDVQVSGLALQTENHWKRLEDRVHHTTTELRGSYAQAGYFLNRSWRGPLPQVEAGYRYAVVNPNRRIGGDLRQEQTVFLNWFLEGHDDKFTFDVSHLSGVAGLSRVRFRAQYDVRF